MELGVLRTAVLPKEAHPMLVAASWAGGGGRIHHASVAAGAGAAAAGITPSMGAKPPLFEDACTNVLLP